jgi:hypothetical protein
MKKNQPIEHKQPDIQPPPFDGYDKDLPRQEALGSKRTKSFQEVAEIRSVNFRPGISGWRLTPLGLELGASSGVFPPGTVTFTDIQNIATNKLLGRSTAGSGVIEQISVGTGLLLSGGTLSSTVTAYTDEQAQDAVGAMADSNTLLYTDATPLLEVKKQMSITADSSGLKLSGDATTPGNNKVYGTDGAGTKGWRDFPGASTFSAYAAGTAYQLTTTAAKLDFGTTDPSITLTAAGTYQLFARARIDYNGATFAANRFVTLKIRRTNNTAADIANSPATFQTAIITTQTYTAAVLNLPVVVYTTANTNDVLELWGSIDTGPTAGSIDAVESEIVAIRIA